MTREEVIRLAREAGFRQLENCEGSTPWFRFAELVAKAERERVIKAVSAAICARGEV